MTREFDATNYNKMMERNARRVAEQSGIEPTQEFIDNYTLRFTISNFQSGKMDNAIDDLKEKERLLEERFQKRRKAFLEDKEELENLIKRKENGEDIELPSKYLPENDWIFIYNSRKVENVQSYLNNHPNMKMEDLLTKDDIERFAAIKALNYMHGKAIEKRIESGEAKNVKPEVLRRMKDSIESVDRMAQKSFNTSMEEVLKTVIDENTGEVNTEKLLEIQRIFRESNLKEDTEKELVRELTDKFMEDKFKYITDDKLQELVDRAINIRNGMLKEENKEKIKTTETSKQ